MLVGEEPGSFLQSTTSIEQHLFARDSDVHPEVAFSGEVLDHPIGKVMRVDDDVANPEAAQACECNLQQRASGNFDQRFGTIVGKRTQTRAQACGEDHRFHSPMRSSSRCQTITSIPFFSRKCLANCSAR